ncbi:hypothetical protein L798_03187 [Zootermopsis nevadensis]|uniref:Uncharacterized protein n=1 Tax=Zootermopsis nevadensis TaxID=136037 RepID=A0A067QIY4_ZOONE|nr:hypothetical protein L798_03187 [Zootermopsis nevadensis]
MRSCNRSPKCVPKTEVPVCRVKCQPQQRCEFHKANINGKLKYSFTCIEA